MKSAEQKHDEKRNADTGELFLSKPAKKARKFFVNIERKPEVAAARNELPVCMHEQEIIEAIHANDVVLITGSTGTGKTTQVPQFLVEDGFGDVHSPNTKGITAVTQPRRVAAITCAKRVAFEMNSKVGDIVGYQIRHEALLGPAVKVKFATDGILLREVEDDMLLRKYSAIIIDEVHERSLNTDLLLSFLSRSIEMRRLQKDKLGSLKVIIMSATLDIEGVFSGNNALFPRPTVITVPSRQYPVTMHFAKKTADSYIEEAFRKVSKIHRRLPQGGILVFLSGRQEVEELCSLLRNEFGDRKVKIPDSDGQELSILVFPFYALLSDIRQRSVFDAIPSDARKVVVATNIAETSVTVPGITYVVDSGRVKERIYKGAGSTLLSSFQVRWVSKASAEQRAGRAGRTGPGHCYRLYSSAVFDQQFEPFRLPEIQRVPADAVVLRLRAMGIRHVCKFPFPSPPDRAEIAAAERLLTDLGALQRAGEAAVLGVTRVGRQLARLPVPPRFGRMLLAARTKPGVARYVCRLAGALGVGTVVNHGAEGFKRKIGLLQSRRGDVLTELAAVCAAEFAGSSSGGVKGFCERHALNGKAVIEAVAVGRQLEKIVLGSVGEGGLGRLGREVEEGVVRAFLSGFGDRVARKMSREEAMAMGVLPKRARKAFCVAGETRAAYLEGGSGVQIDSIEFVCFVELVEVAVRRKKVAAEQGERDDYDASDEEGEGKVDRQKPQEAEQMPEKRILVLRGATIVKRDWLAREARAMCKLLPTKDEVGAAKYDRKTENILERMRVYYGQANWPLGEMYVSVGSGVEVRGRLKLFAKTFAQALLDGKVKSWLRVDGSGAVRDAVCKRLAEKVEGVLAVKDLVERIESKGDFLTNVVSAGFRGEVVKSWRLGIERLIAEEGSGAGREDGLGVPREEEEDEYGG